MGGFEPGFPASCQHFRHLRSGSPSREDGRRGNRMPSRPILALAAALALLAGPVPAHATATLTCSAEDRHVGFELFGNIGSGDGAAVQITEGSIKLKPVRGKFEATEFKVDPSHIAGNWSFGRELRIGIAPDKVGEVTVYLAILAERSGRSSDDLERYRGNYVLKVTGPKGLTELKGRLKDCDAD